MDVKQLTELFRKIKIIKRRSAVKLSSCKDKKMKNKWHELKMSSDKIYDNLSTMNIKDGYHYILKFENKVLVLYLYMKHLQDKNEINKMELWEFKRYIHKLWNN